MTLNGFLLVLISISFSTLGQFSFKSGINRLSLPDSANLGDKLLGFASSPFILGGLSCYAIGTVFWLMALRHLDLSLAYPFVALSIVAVFTIGIVGFGEPANTAKVAGMGLIVLGLVVLTRA